MEKENKLTPNLINRTEMKQVAVSDDAYCRGSLITTSVTSTFTMTQISTSLILNGWSCIFFNQREKDILVKDEQIWW